MLKTMMVIFFTALLNGCVRPADQPISPPSFNKKTLVGLWAMLPLNNGIANVVEFRSDDRVLLHEFNCENPLIKIGVENSHYTVDESNQTIRLASAGHVTQLKFLGIAGQIMKLKQPIEFEDESLTFSYLRVEKIMPICGFYKPKDKSKETAYKPDNFIANPVIPAHNNLEKYVGQWQDKKVTQLEVAKDKQGEFIIFHAKNENWRYLFNSVRWVGDELNFNSYAYSEKPDLFDHPYHKSLTPTKIYLLPNDKMHMTIYINGKNFDFELTRK